MHVLVEQGGSPLTYVLRDESGRMAVDDVLVPARIDELPPLTGLAGQLASRAGSQTQGAQKSLKSTFELMIPVLDFARGLKDSDMEVVRGCATRDFSRGAWNHFESTPEFDADPVACLHRPLRAVMASGDRAVVVLGDERHGAQVTLLKERGKYRIDDVTLVLGPPPAEPIGLKKAIRMQLAEGRK
jgi:hypothetical protein